MVIQSFSDRNAEEYFRTGQLGERVGWAAVAQVVTRKLDMLHYAARLSDMAAPPGNRLESLKGAMKGLHSIRINDQWRVVFRWTDNGPLDVRITGYH